MKKSRTITCIILALLIVVYNLNVFALENDSVNVVAFCNIISNLDGYGVSADFTSVNNGNGFDSFECYAVLYDSEDAMKNFVSSTVELQAGETKVTNLFLKLSDVAGGDYVKCFALENKDSLKTLGNVLHIKNLTAEDYQEIVFEKTVFGSISSAEPFKYYKFTVNNTKSVEVQYIASAYGTDIEMVSDNYEVLPAIKTAVGKVLRLNYKCQPGTYFLKIKVSLDELGDFVDYQFSVNNGDFVIQVNEETDINTIGGHYFVFETDISGYYRFDFKNYAGSFRLFSDIKHSIPSKETEIDSENSQYMATLNAGIYFAELNSEENYSVKISRANDIEPITFSLCDASVTCNSTFTVPIVLSGMGNIPIDNVGILIDYDNNMLEPVGVSNGVFETNAVIGVGDTGICLSNLGNDESISQNGNLYYLTMRAKGKAGKTELKFKIAEFLINGIKAYPSLVDGTVIITSNSDTTSFVQNSEGLAEPSDVYLQISGIADGEYLAKDTMYIRENGELIAIENIFQYSSENTADVLFDNTKKIFDVDGDNNITLVDAHNILKMISLVMYATPEQRMLSTGGKLIENRLFPDFDSFIKIVKMIACTWETPIMDEEFFQIVNIQNTVISNERFEAVDTVKPIKIRTELDANGISKDNTIYIKNESDRALYCYLYDNDNFYDIDNIGLVYSNVVPAGEILNLGTYKGQYVLGVFDSPVNEDRIFVNETTEIYETVVSTTVTNLAAVEEEPLYKILLKSETSDLKFEQLNWGTFVYDNDPEFITESDMADSDLGNRWLMTAEGLTGVVDFQSSHSVKEYIIEDGPVYFDIAIHNPTEQTLTVKIERMGFQLPGEYQVDWTQPNYTETQWACLKAWADFLRIDIEEKMFVGDLKNYYKPYYLSTSNSPDFSNKEYVLKSGETVWLLGKDRLRMSRECWSPINIVTRLQISEGGVVDLKFAAFRDINKIQSPESARLVYYDDPVERGYQKYVEDIETCYHECDCECDCNCDCGVVYERECRCIKKSCSHKCYREHDVDGKQKGISQSVAETQTRVDWIIDDNTEYFTPTLYNHANPGGYTINETGPYAYTWVTHFNPNADSYGGKNIGVESDIIPLVFEGKNSFEEEGIWVFDNLHSKPSLGNVVFEPAQNIIVSEAMPLGNYGVVERYYINVINFSNRPKSITYKMTTSSHVIIMYKIGDDEWKRKIKLWEYRKNHEENDKIVYDETFDEFLERQKKDIFNFEIASGETKTVVVEVILPNADPGGIKHQFACE